MLSVILIGISLSMDAFAVSVTNGIAMRPFKTGYALWHGLYFGAFQFLMPLAGYILGSTVSGYVTAIGPYVSFALLAFIGGKMILEAVRGGEEGSGGMAVLSHKRLLALAVATSIDALAVGVSFAFSPPPAPALYSRAPLSAAQRSSSPSAAPWPRAASPASARKRRRSPAASFWSASE